MKTNRRYTPQEKLDALALIKGGMKPRDAARKLGLNPDTVEYWAKVHPESVGWGPKAPETPGESNVRPGKIEIDPANRGGAAAGTGAGGADAARRGAGVDSPSAGGSSPGSGSSAQGAPPPQPTIPPEMALVMLSGLALRITTRVYCARYDVPFDEKMQAASKFTPEEYKSLMETAPYAAPLVAELLIKYGKYIGGAVYLGVFYMILVDRVSIIKELAPKEKVDEVKEKQEAAKAQGRKAAAAAANGSAKELYALWSQSEKGSIPRSAN